MPMLHWWLNIRFGVVVLLRFLSPVASVLVRTRIGDVLGAQNGSCTVFWGIPYAEPPVGPRRWRPPQAATSWAGVLDARADNKPICVQQPDAGQFDAPGWIERLEEAVLGYSDTTMQEDCLHINVQTPNISGSRPVMLYIHGGSNLVGSGSGYYAQQLCDVDVVFVSFNYRLGVLGTLAMPEALDESGTAGNYGLQDQREAMRWVQNNIHLFGGDPSRVTISGESAGAMAVAAHLALPRSTSLFSQAIMMSGNDDTLSLNEAYAAGDQFVSVAGCQNARDRLACLRKLRPWELVNIQTRVYNESMRALQVPVADGYELTVGRRLRDVFGSEDVQAKPVLAGTNVDDISTFFGLTLEELIPAVLGLPMVTESQMRAVLPRLLPNASSAQLEQAMQLYDPGQYHSARQALYDLGTDGYFFCPTRRVVAAMASKLPKGVFQYVFASNVTCGLCHSYSAAVWKILKRGEDAYVKPWLGAFHGANEVLFWRHADPSSHLTVDEGALGDRLVKHWASFVTSGAPLPAWPPFEGEAEEYFYRLDKTGDSVGKHWHTEKCNFLEQFRFVWNPVSLRGGPFMEESVII